MLSAKRLATIAIALVLAGCLWIRFGYEPDPGSHRISIEHLDADGTNGGAFEPFDVSVELVDGVLADLPPPLRPGWDDAGFGVVRSTIDAGVMTVDGQTGPRAVVNWRTSGAGTLRVGVDGSERETVVVTEPGTGGIVLDFALRPRPHSILLLGCFFGWTWFAVTMLRSPVRTLGERWLPRGRLTRVVATVGTLAVAGIAIVVAPVARPAVVRYDVVVQPIDTVELTVTLENASGAVLERRTLDVSDGWSGAAGEVTTNGTLPLHWTYVGSPDDRLVLGGSPIDGRASVRVNGDETELEVGTPSRTALRALGSPVSRLDRAVLAASWPADAVLITFAAIGVAALIERFRQGRARSRPADGRAETGVARFAVLPFAVWSSLVIVFWPGMMNPDSVSQWRQLSDGNLQDWHPYPVNVAWGLLQKVVDLPALPILLVAAAVAWLVGYVADRALRCGAPRWAAWTAVVGVAVFPITSILTVSLWKDIVMGVGVLALAIVIWRSEMTGSQWLERRKIRVAFAVGACLTIWLSRHNGWPIAVLPLVAVMLARREARRSVASVLVVTVAVALVVRFPLKQALDVGESPVATIAAVQRIAAHVEAGTHIPDDDAVVLEKLRPLDQEWPYDCQTVQTTWFGPQAIPFGSYVNEGDRLREIWLDLALRAPDVELRHVACSSQILWRVTDAGSVTYFIHGDTRPGFVDTIPTRDGTMPMEAHPSRELARRVFDGYAGLPSPLIRPALPTYILFGLALAVAVRRRSLSSVLIVSPAIVQTVTLIPTALVQDTRFQYGTVLLAVVASPLLVAELARSRTHGSTDDPGPALDTEAPADG